MTDITTEEYWDGVRKAAEEARRLPFWKRIDLGVNAPKTWTEYRDALELARKAEEMEG